MSGAGPWAAQSWGDVRRSVGTANRQSRIHHGDVIYAGFWVRAGGLIIDGILIVLAQLAAAVPVRLFAIVVGNSLTTCRTSSLGSYSFSNCDGAIEMNVAMTVAIQIVGFAVWWKLVPVKIATRGSTIGMKALGLKMVTAEGFRSVGRGQVFLRSLLASGFMVLALAPWIVVMALEGWVVDIWESWGDPGGGAVWIWVAAVSFTPVLFFLTYLWNVVDRRYQTLHDKVAGTVVICA